MQYRQLQQTCTYNKPAWYKSASAASQQAGFAEPSQHSSALFKNGTSGSPKAGPKNWTAIYAL